MTIVELYNGLGKSEQRLLLGRIILDGVSSSAAYAWCKGQRLPKKLYRDRISQHVKNVTGLTLAADELFPEK